jgi:MYXO-CTERM domain-containing protein
VPNSSDDQPKYLRCARALALLTGLAGSVTACESTAGASVYDGGPVGVTAHPDAADADSPTGAYDGGFYGTRVISASGCGCDLGGAPVSPSVPLVAGVVGAGLIARRRRRSDVP